MVCFRRLSTAFLFGSGGTVGVSWAREAERGVGYRQATGLAKGYLPPQSHPRLQSGEG